MWCRSPCATASDPRDLHTFATKVVATARNVEAAKTAIAERVRVAERQLSDALRDRAAVEQAVSDLVAATWEVDEVKAIKQAVEAFASTAPEDDRRARKARESVRALHDDGNRWAQEALIEQERVRRDSEHALREATSHEQEGRRAAEGGATKMPPTEPVAGEPAEPKLADSGDVLDHIRKLGELHSAGILTTEEFAAKKAELLARL